jgi:hypothetical protein
MFTAIAFCAFCEMCGALELRPAQFFANSIAQTAAMVSFVERQEFT